MRHDQLPGELRRLAFEFFYWFSRFEFALKANGFLISEEPGAKAQPSWTKFIRAFEGAYSAGAFAHALIDANPRRQIVGDGELIFVDLDFPPGTTELERVVRLSQTVRNNLFHGGKSAHDGWDDPPRIKQLLELALPILDELATLGGFESDYRGEY